MNFPLISNNSVKDSFLNCVKAGRIPHAIIIEGESGTGKSEFAKYIAKTVFCESENKPCLKCKSCNLVDVGTHMDLFTVTPEESKKNIRVHQVKEMRLRAYQKPQASDTNIFIIDRAETLNQQSQNTLLKVLEEPPSNAIFIFLANGILNLLPTVISRCVVYSLTVPSVTETAQYLNDNKFCDKNKAIETAQKASGNIKTALFLLNKGKLDDFNELAISYLDAIFDRDIYSLLTLVSKLEKDRVGTQAFFTTLRSLMLNEIKNNAGDKQKIKTLLKLVDVTDSLFMPLKTNINLPLLFTSAAYRYYDCLKI